VKFRKSVNQKRCTREKTVKNRKKCGQKSQKKSKKSKKSSKKNAFWVLFAHPPAILIEN